MEHLGYARFLFKGLMTCSNSLNPQNNRVRQALISDLRGEVAEGQEIFRDSHKVFRSELKAELWTQVVWF